jgi:glutamyl-tRNA synthetase
LSKRHGAVGVDSYQKQGYQPESIINYLALLGWNPGTEEEVLSMNRLVELFDLSKVQKKSAIFDITKLNWISGQHLKSQKNSDILIDIRKIDQNWGVRKNDAYCRKVIELNKMRSKSLNELIINSDYLFNQPDYLDEDIYTAMVNENNIHMITNYLKDIEDVENWDIKSVENKSRAFIENNKMGFGKIMKIIRFVLCGTLKGPSIFEVMILLGKKNTTTRLKKFKMININKNENE